MRKKTLQKMKDVSAKELEKQAEDARVEILSTQADLASGKEKDTSKIARLRRDRAQLLTLINQTT